MSEQAYAEAVDVAEESAEVCGVCGTAENIVDGHMIETPTGEICIDCWIDVIDGPVEQD